jgi:hypothetical protein
MFKRVLKVMFKKNVVVNGILMFIPFTLIVLSIAIREQNIVLSNIDICLALITSVAIGLLTADKK